MNIVSISDTHGKHNSLDMTKYPGDVLVHAGDFTGVGSKTAVILFLEWFETQPYKYLVLIAGNHETVVESDADWFKHVLKEFPTVIYLEDSEVVIEGIKFYGSPYSNEFYNWAFMEEEIDLVTVWNKIPEDTQVLITHGPAYGCNDLVSNTWGARDPHVGSKSLQHKKKQLHKLTLHISGHIHEDYGITMSEDVINICASILNEKYKVTNAPITITI